MHTLRRLEKILSFRHPPADLEALDQQEVKAEAELKNRLVMCRARAQRAPVAARRSCFRS